MQCEGVKRCGFRYVLSAVMLLVGVAAWGTSAAAQGIDTCNAYRTYGEHGDDSYYAQFDSTERAQRLQSGSVMLIDTAAVDSLAYARAERAFELKNYVAAEDYLKDYTVRFMGGEKEFAALLMLGEAQIALGKEDEGGYNVGLVAEDARDPVVKARANMLLAPLCEKRGDLERAYEAYMGGVAAAASPASLSEMYRKSILIAGQLDAQEKIVRAADAMMASPGVSLGLVQFARYQRAYALLKLNSLDEAYAEFKVLAEGNRTEAGAECRYRMVEILLMKEEHEKVQQMTIWAAQQDKGGHDYWVAKGYLAMARSLLAQGRTLDARKTLNSLIRGYPKEDDGIRTEAEEGMRAIMLGSQSW